MLFEWDPDKEVANRQRHRIPFEVAARIFEGPPLRKATTHEQEAYAKYLQGR